jgi:hypothetical protein
LSGERETRFNYRAMNLADARTALIAAIGKMNSLYGRTLFDEWVLVSLKPERGTILAYSGPRQDKYKQSFTTDLKALQKELEDHKLAIGDFAFAASAEGENYDCCMRLGESGYLFCNNTTKTMSELRQDPKWLQAQKRWAELSHQFIGDPLV